MSAVVEVPPSVEFVGDTSLWITTGALMTLVAAVTYIWSGLALAAVFRKLCEDAWRAWVPVLNVSTLLGRAGLAPALAWLALVPPGAVVVYVLLLVSAHRLNPRFGYGRSMTVLAAFFFLVWASIVGFGPAREREMRSPTPAAVTDATTSEIAARGSRVRAQAAAEERGHAVASDIAAIFAGGESPTAHAGAAPVPISRRALRKNRTFPLVPETTPAPSMVLAVARTGDDRWHTEVDEVSAISPPPFPPRVTAASEDSGGAGAPEAGTAGVALDEVFDETRLAHRSVRAQWQFVPTAGVPLAVTSTVVIVGRHPVADPAYPRAQLLAVPDESRTVSKTHVRLERDGQQWRVSDLRSTNGVFVRTSAGDDIQLTDGELLGAGEPLLLGDEEFSLRHLGN